MERSKIIALLIAAFYIAFIIYLFVVQAEHDEQATIKVLGTIVGVLIWLVFSLGLIWYGDELGEGTVGARYGLVSSPSPGWAVRMMGWVFLVMPAVIFVSYWIKAHLQGPLK